MRKLHLNENILKNSFYFRKASEMALESNRNIQIFINFALNIYKLQTK